MRHYNITEVKFTIGDIVSKVLGVNQNPITDKELDILIFALESNIIFDKVGERIVPALDSMQELPEKPVIEGDEPTDEEALKLEDYEMQFNMRQQQIRSLFASALREDIQHGMRMRFGI